MEFIKLFSFINSGMSNLDTEVMRLSAAYRPLAAEILREAIRIPADYVDRPVSEVRTYDFFGVIIPVCRVVILAAA